MCFSNFDCPSLFQCVQYECICPPFYTMIGETCKESTSYTHIAILGAACAFSSALAILVQCIFHTSIQSRSRFHISKAWWIVLEYLGILGLLLESGSAVAYFFVHNFHWNLFEWFVSTGNSLSSFLVIGPCIFLYNWICVFSSYTFHQPYVKFIALLFWFLSVIRVFAIISNMLSISALVTIIIYIVQFYLEWKLYKITWVNEENSPSASQRVLREILQTCESSLKHIVIWSVIGFLNEFVLFVSFVTNYILLAWTCIALKGIIEVSPFLTILFLEQQIYNIV